MSYVTPKQAAKILGVHVSSLRRWESEGKLRAIRTPGGQRRYDLKEVERAAPATQTVVTVCYARVSTHSQRDDLERQIEFLRSRFPDAELLSDIGSGLNFRRRKFLAILDSILTGDVQRLVVAHPDRLVRFGFELVKWLCERSKVELVVLHERRDAPWRVSTFSPEQELVADMLSIIHCFSGRLYGLRKYQKQVREALQEDCPTLAHQKPDKAAAEQCQENQDISKS